jgi:hypothetical protein
MMMAALRQSSLLRNVAAPLELEADHRRHAEMGGSPPTGPGSGCRSSPITSRAGPARIGLGEGIVTTKTLRRLLFSLAGRLTRSARRWRLHLPARWPWALGFTAALARLREIPLLA